MRSYTVVCHNLESQLIIFLLCSSYLLTIQHIYKHINMSLNTLNQVILFIHIQANLITQINMFNNLIYCTNKIYTYTYQHDRYQQQIFKVLEALSYTYLYLVIQINLWFQSTLITSQNYQQSTSNTYVYLLTMLLS